MVPSHARGKLAGLPGLMEIAGAIAMLSLTAGPAAAAPFTLGDLVAVVEMSPFPFPSYIVELTPTGSQVQWIAVANLGDAVARDIVIDAQGQAYLIDGRSQSNLEKLDPSSGTWSSRTVAGWGTSDFYGHAGIALAQGSVLVTDAGTGASEGLIRFPSGAGTPDRPLQSVDYTDVVTGLDGNVYALDTQGGNDGVAVDVLDPGSLALLRRVTLPPGLAARGLAVDAAGHIFVASWQAAVYRLSASGVLEASSSLASLGLSPQALIDIDVTSGGQLVMGSSTGGVLITSTTFDPARSMSVNLGNYGVSTFVGIVPALATPVRRSTWGELKSRFH